MVLNEEMKNWITTWDGMLTYYMERENTPDDPEDREVYYTAIPLILKYFSRR